MSTTDFSCLGRVTRQTIHRVTPAGYYIETPVGTAFLDAGMLKSPAAEGDTVEVCIYHDYEGHLTATTRKPDIQVGETALLRIKAAGDKGAFADWGLPKDLFIPHAEQVFPLKQGLKVVIHAYIDELTGRIAGSTRVDKFYPDKPSTGEISEGDQVEVLIYRKTELGWKGLVNGSFTGVLYLNELPREVEAGDVETAYIKTLRTDGKVDLSLRRPGYDEVLDARDYIRNMLDEQGGFLPYHDKTPPELIRSQLGMSKRTFKAAIGGLLKEGVIQIEKDGIVLK